MSIPQVFSPGPQMVDGGALNKAVGAQLQNYQDALVALANGGQVGATPLIIGINRIATVANANDSCMMPPSTPGATVKIRNDGASNTTIYSSLTSSIPAATLDTINGTAGATGVTVAPGSTAELSCYKAGAWVGTLGET